MKRLRKVLLLILILIVPMLSGCQTCQKGNQESDLAEILKNLDPGLFPELPDISILDSEEKVLILSFLVDAYSEHLKLLIASKATGRFIDDIDYEIEYCQDALDWLESLSLEMELLD